MGEGTEPADFSTGLVARLYGPLRSSTPDPAPYTRFVRRANGPALELGCGDGDPLLTLRQDRLDVEGLESSADMLDRCRTRAEEAGLDVVLHHARMETMDLGRRYRAIYLAGPTFNLLPDDVRAADALARIRGHLDADGLALIPTFVPAADQHIGAATESGSMRVTTVAVERDETRRRMTTLLRYEAGDEVIERPWMLHWYTQDGFRALATAAGLELRAVLAPDGSKADPEATVATFFLGRRMARSDT